MFNAKQQLTLYLQQLSEDQLDNPLWEFACTFYAQDGASTLLLRLQNEFGFNINALITAFWLKDKHISIPSLQEMNTLAQLMDKDFIAPLRTSRQKLKHSHCPTSIYETIKASELLLEQQSLAVIYLHTSKILNTVVKAELITDNSLLEAVLNCFQTDPSEDSTINQILKEIIEITGS